MICSTPQNRTRRASYIPNFGLKVCSWPQAAESPYSRRLEHSGRRAGLRKVFSLLGRREGRTIGHHHLRLAEVCRLTVRMEQFRPAIE